MTLQREGLWNAARRRRSVARRTEQGWLLPPDVGLGCSSRLFVYAVWPPRAVAPPMPPVCNGHPSVQRAALTLARNGFVQ